MLELRPMAVVMSALRIARRVAASLGMNRRTLWADERAFISPSIDAIVRSERCLMFSRINGLAEMEIRQSAAFILLLPSAFCEGYRWIGFGGDLHRVPYMVLFSLGLLSK